MLQCQNLFTDEGDSPRVYLGPQVWYHLLWRHCSNRDTLETCQNFLRHKSHRICWHNAIFYHKFLRQEIDKISLFKDISWNKKFKKIFPFPMVFWVRKLVETIQLFFHCCPHTFRENTVFEMIFWSRKVSKEQKFGNISWCNKWIRKLNFSYNFYDDAKDDGISTFGLILCVSPQKIFRKLRNIQEIKPKVNILSSCLHWKMWGIFSFLFHLLHPKIFPKLCFFEDFLNQKIISKTVLSSDICWQQWKNNCIVSTNFLTQKTIGKGVFFSQIFCFKKCL